MAESPRGLGGHHDRPRQKKGLGVRGFRLRVSGLELELEFGFWNLEFVVWCLLFVVSGFRFEVLNLNLSLNLYLILEFGLWNLEFKENKEGGWYKTLRRLAIIVDGPLAVFSTASWLTKSIEKELSRINCSLPFFRTSLNS
ncbi:hypothetical protein [Allomuricauda sp. ARW1Y1]|jgi:hypothetical protein|uniref:hypothetical protein n=1 Tax=Allomuricauda sp. ARW1Y1 TaxID=2663843 RepID=UPI0015CEE8A2|nr:hypothetical protein [Muricauda sp. ARW1Y1]NYJ29158.1 hypothetical protein [Muricauda sp. ARW1Y1]